MPENHSKSVLVVDDDSAISTLIRRNLEGNNLHVIEAATGLDGIRLLQENIIDLLILDLGLPDYNGWGILSLLRLTEAVSRIPVIVVSVEPPDSALIRRLKPNDYVQKPFDVSELLQKIQKALSAGEGQRSLEN